MSLLSVLSFLWHHKPDADTMLAVKKVTEAAETFIEVLKEELPAIEGKQEAIDQVNQVVAQCHVVLARSAQDKAPDAAPPTT